MDNRDVRPAQRGVTQPDRFAFLPGESAEERDDRLRGAGYTARCAHWESLTVEDIWGPDGEPPFPPIAPFRTSDAAHAAEDVADPNPAPLPTDPWSVTK